MKHTNIGRSVRIARAQAGSRNGDIARHLGISRQRVSVIANSEHANTQTVERLAEFFGMTTSEFIALGETDDAEQ